MVTRGKYYNRTNTCDRCETEKLKSHNAYREIKGENWTGNWLCGKCHWIDERNRRDSIPYLRRQMTKTRLCNLDSDSSKAKGDLFQELTCIWRTTISTIPVKDLNKEFDNYRYPIDHSRDSELGVIQTKGSFYNQLYDKWSFTRLERDWYKEFDYMICYCVGRDGKLIERIYIFPWEEIIKRKGIHIKRDISNKNGKCPGGEGWYEVYRVKNDEDIKRIDDIWKELMKGGK